MPLYEYVCGSCNKSIEKLILKIEDRNSQKCECGSSLTLVPSCHAVPIFKGVIGSCSMNNVPLCP